MRDEESLRKNSRERERESGWWPATEPSSQPAEATRNRKPSGVGGDCRDQNHTSEEKRRMALAAAACTHTHTHTHTVLYTVPTYTLGLSSAAVPYVAVCVSELNPRRKVLMPPELVLWWWWSLSLSSSTSFSTHSSRTSVAAAAAAAAVLPDHHHHHHHRGQKQLLLSAAGPLSTRFCDNESSADGGGI